MKVVNVRHERCTHYIGRGPGPSGVATNLGNPFRITERDHRAEVIGMFESWARQNPAVLERIKALPADAVLGCWCAPQACHGDIIKKLWKEMHS